MEHLPPQKRYKYEKIVDYYSSAIHKGDIRCGEKLPSLRKTASQFDCAVSVAMQAYHEMEVINLIRGVEKSGYFALPSQQSKPPAPQNYRHTMHARPSTPHASTARIVAIGMDNTILPLGCAVPDTSILPVKKLRKIFNSQLQASPRLFSEYSPASGSDYLRQQIGKIMLDRGVAVSSDDILVTSGCAEALSIALRSCTKRGDTIAVESPTYFGLLTLLNSLQRRVIEIPSSLEHGLELDKLELALQRNDIQAVVFTANFQNPLGSVMPANRKQALIDLAEKYDITLIEDDIYGECAFDGSPHPPAKQLDTNNRVIYCSSFSKTLSPGVRVGWLIGGKHHQRCQEIKFSETLGGPKLLQQSMGDFLDQGGYMYHMRNFRRTIAKQSFEIKQLLMNALPATTKISHPTGGYFLWLELPERVSSLQVFEEALQQKIGVVPGAVFSCQQNIFTNCLRISCGSPVTEQTKSGINTLGNIVETLMHKI